jgi:hypothetical protein
VSGELPIVDELEAEFRALVAHELRVRSRRRPRVAPGRVARRAALVLALLCLVGTVALAARSGLGGDAGAPPDSAPARLGAAAGATLSAYRHGGRPCLELQAGGDVASECGVRALSAADRTRRWVAGVTAAGAAQVLVEVGGRRVVVATHPGSQRWFVAVLRLRGARRAAPARITPRDNTGRVLGPAVLDCSLAVIGPACEHRIGG